MVASNLHISDCILTQIARAVIVELFGQMCLMMIELTSFTLVALGQSCSACKGRPAKS